MITAGLGVGSGGTIVQYMVTTMGLAPGFAHGGHHHLHDGAARDDTQARRNHQPEECIGAENVQLDQIWPRRRCGLMELDCGK